MAYLKIFISSNEMNNNKKSITYIVTFVNIPLNKDVTLEINCGNSKMNVFFASRSRV